MYVFVRPHISQFSSPFINSLLIVSSTPITIGIAVTLMFNSFSGSQARSVSMTLLSMLAGLNNAMA